MQDRSRLHQVILRERLSPGTVRLRLERRGLDFHPGQYMALGMSGGHVSREYSLHSSVDDPWLDFLIREVGETSRSLAGKAPEIGDAVEAEGPFGFFGLEADERDAGPPVLLIASGVGIAPFHSMVESWPKLDYLLLHGVRCASELYDHHDFDPERHVPCISGRDCAGFYGGRVTDWLLGQSSQLSQRWGSDWATRTICLLAGNSDMVHDVWDGLADCGISPDRIRTEIFF